MSDLNKIFIQSSLKVKLTSNSVFCFADGRLLPRNEFVLEDGVLTLRNDASNDVSIYYGYDTGILYEFKRVITGYNTIIAGVDDYGYELVNMTSKDYVLVFVNGIALNRDQFTVIDHKHLQVFLDFPPEEINTVQIYVSKTIIYRGRLLPEQSSSNVFNITYNKDKSLFFVNGDKISFLRVQEYSGNCLINYPLEESDILEYFFLPDSMLSLHFVASTGYIEYSGLDYYSRQIPVMHSYIATFDDNASLLIDGLRPGFLLKEVNGDGCLVMLGPDFDTPSIYCSKILGFSTTNYNSTEYYVEVPECRSIVEYLSSFDQQFKLLPEVLSVLQSFLLREIYDEAIRIKNLRSLTKVDSSYINNLITFLGFDMDIKRFPLKKRREILEELNNFYRMVGTKESYNFFNIIESEYGIREMNQLFTYKNSNLTNQREYVDFYKMRDLGDAYQEHIEFLSNQEDYGSVTDFVGETRDYGPAIMTEDAYEFLLENDDTLTAEEQARIENYMRMNLEVSGLDYGYVYIQVKGKWVRWYTFNRPKNLYPTNHVAIDLEFKSLSHDSLTLFEEFKNKLYNLASAVLYIHEVIETYSFGLKKIPTAGNLSQTKQLPQFGIMVAPVRLLQSYRISHDVALTNARLRAYRLGDTCTFTVYPTPSDATVTLTATGYTQQGNSITVPRGTLVTYSVSKEGYIPSEPDTIILNQDDSVAVVLTQWVTLTVNPTPNDATVTLTATGYTQQNNSITVPSGTTVDYSVSKANCTTTTGFEVVTSTHTTSLSVGCTLTVNPTPSDATVTFSTGTISGNTCTVPYGTSVTYSVSKEGYIPSEPDTIILNQDDSVAVVLTQWVTLTINPTPSDATVVLTAAGYTQQNNSITVPSGTTVNYSVSKTDYPTKTGSVTVTSDQVVNVGLYYTPSVNETIVNLSGASAYTDSTIYAPGRYRIEAAPGVWSWDVVNVGDTSKTDSAYKTVYFDQEETITEPFMVIGYCGSNAVSDTVGGTNPYSGEFKVNAVDARTIINNQLDGVDVNHIFGAGGGNGSNYIHTSIVGTGTVIDIRGYSGGGGNCLGDGNITSYTIDSGTTIYRSTGAGTCVHLLPMNGVFGTDYLRAVHLAPIGASANGSAYGGAATIGNASGGWFTRGGNSPYGTGATTINSAGTGVGAGQPVTVGGAGAYFNGTQWVDITTRANSLTNGELGPNSHIRITYLGPNT